MPGVGYNRRFMRDRPHFFGMTADQIANRLASAGMPRFRGKQVVEWVYQHGITDPQEMTSIAQADRDRLADVLDFVLGTVLQHQQASDGTQKLLIDWSQGSGISDQGPGESEDARHGRRTRLSLIPDPRALIPDSQTECVMIPATSRESGRDRRTACISSQIGCPVGCRFCASGLGGLDGNLTAGQIVQQVWQLGRLPGVGRITNVVFMGMGEPLANFEAVTAAARLISAECGLGISPRRITISTVGVPSGIRRLADLDLPVTLAISLHAPNDGIRRQIIPWAQFVSIDQLVEAGSYYFERTGREVTLEYILLGGLNDQPEHARELAGVAKRLRANLNLIRYNQVKGLPYQRPASEDVRQFQAILRKASVNTHIRASRGRDIAAACGQLRHEHSRQPTA